MCIFSACGQLVYGVLMVGCLVLTAVATFTSSWAEVKNLPGLEGPHTGILPFACVTKTTGDTCSNWWNNSGTWLRAVGVMMCIALALEILALAWNLVTCFACCCKKYLIHPLSLFAVLITLFLLTSVIVYGVNKKDAFGKDVSWKDQIQLGWSFWLALAALVLAAADVVVGAITVCLGRNNL